MKKIQGETHWEPTRSDAILKYVWKEDTREGEQYEFGVMALNSNTSEGKVAANKRKYNMLMNGKTLEQLALEGDIAIHEIPVLKKAKTILENERLVKYNHNTVRGMWIQGTSGSGKDLAVQTYCEEHGLTLYKKLTKDKFFNGYAGEKAIVF